MTENQEQIERLQAQLDKLVRTQIDFQREVSLIRSELDQLRPPKPEIPLAVSAPPPAESPLKVERPVDDFATPSGTNSTERSIPKMPAAPANPGPRVVPPSFR